MNTICSSTVYWLLVLDERPHTPQATDTRYRKLTTFVSTILQKMQTPLQSTKLLSIASKRFVFTALDIQSAPSQSDKLPSDTHPKRIIDLPDDILIPIFSHCNIDAILSLRLTCTAFCAVVKAYITAIAPASARTTYPDCDLLLRPPKDGYSFRWMINLIPAQLASVVLDKDKLRRHPYINSGFLYGIPSESDCPGAIYWRQRVANGWKVLRSFHLISSRVYANCEDACKRPNAFRKVSGGVRTSRIWQAMSCQYAGCTEHGMKHVFASKTHRRDSHQSHTEEQKDAKDPIPDVRRKEAQILKKRLAHLDDLSDQDLLDYVYLWRLLLHVFRPYTKPSLSLSKPTQSTSPLPSPNWPTIINDISQGCSWLNYFILHIGPSPFLTQWSLSRNSSSSATPFHHLRDTIWSAWTARTTHQIELEREYASKFEFQLRKRCLSPERLKRREDEICRGRIINTISLDCIPWAYDQHYRLARLNEDFPWYKAGQRVCLEGGWTVECEPGNGWSVPWVFKGGLCRKDDNVEPGPLVRVPYLVYLGTEEAGKVWPGSEGEGAELAF